MYDFWIYICPSDASFSARQAVKSLREAFSHGTVPFGTIQLTEEPIIDILTRYIINEQMLLPSEASKQLLSILIINGYAKKKMIDAKEKSIGTKKNYENN